MTDTTTEAPVINRALFGQIREWFTAHPEAHNNSAWSNCVGGKAIKIISEEDTVQDGADKLLADGTVPRNIKVEVWEVCRCCGYGPSLSEIAGYLLGLTPRQAHDLFYDTDTADARAMVHMYADGLDPQEWFDYAASLGTQEV